MFCPHHVFDLQLRLLDLKITPPEQAQTQLLYTFQVVNMAALVLLLLFFSYSPALGTKKIKDERVSMPTGKNIDRVLEADESVLFEFYAPWCRTCKARKRIYHGKQLGRTWCTPGAYQGITCAPEYVKVILVEKLKKKNEAPARASSEEAYTKQVDKPAHPKLNELSDTNTNITSDIPSPQARRSETSDPATSLLALVFFAVIFIGLIMECSPLLRRESTTTT